MITNSNFNFSFQELSMRIDKLIHLLDSALEEYEEYGLNEEFQEVVIKKHEKLKLLMNSSGSNNKRKNKPLNQNFSSTKGNPKHTKLANSLFGNLKEMCEVGMIIWENIDKKIYQDCLILRLPVSIIEPTIKDLVA